jgi:hypothetical protein
MELIFAGVEDRQIRNDCYGAGVKKVLMSYYYIIDKGVPFDEVLDMFPLVVLDSGAFTMFSKAQDNHEKINHVKYLSDYLNFASKYIGRLFWVANYDVNLLVGDKQVYDWNKEFEQLEKEGQRVCYVTHDYSLPYKNLYEYFDRYNFIGASGGINSKTDTGYFEQVYNLSSRYRKLVHGFAMTNFVSFDKFPLFSADSTTYFSGGKYGITYVWNGSFFETIDYTKKEAIRRQQFRTCHKWGVDFGKFMDDNTRQVNKFNINAWLMNEKNFNRRTLNRQWWLTEAERDFIKTNPFYMCTPNELEVMHGVAPKVAPKGRRGRRKKKKEENGNT